MGGFNDFLVGATEGGVVGLEKRAQDDLKLQRQMSLEEYRLARQAHYNRILRAEEFAEKTDPTRIAIVEDATDKSSEREAARKLLPGATATRKVLQKEAADLAGSTAEAQEDGQIKAQLRNASAVQDKELRLLWGRFTDGAESLDAAGIERTNDNLTALYNGVYKTKLPTVANTAVATAANKKFLSAQIERSVKSASGLYGAAVTRVAGDMIDLIPDDHKFTKNSPRTKSDLQASLGLYASSITSESDSGNAERYYKKVMDGLIKVAADVDGPERDQLLQFSKSVRTAHDELLELQQHLNLHPGMSMSGVGELATRLRADVSGDKSRGYTMFNTPGIRAAATANLGAAERGQPLPATPGEPQQGGGLLSLNDQQGVKGSPPPPAEEPATQGLLATPQPPASVQDPQAEPPVTPPAPEQQQSVPVIQDMQVRMTELFSKDILAKVQASPENGQAILADYRQRVEDTVNKASKSQGGFVPDEDVATTADAIWNSILETLKAGR